MTRDEMFEKLDRILEDMDAIALLLASSGNTPIRPIHTRISKRLHAVLDALRAEAPSPSMPVIEVGDVIEFAHGNDAPLFQRLSHPAAVEDWNGKLGARVLAVYRAIWRREASRG